MGNQESGEQDAYDTQSGASSQDSDDVPSPPLPTQQQQPQPSTASEAGFEIPVQFMSHEEAMFWQQQLQQIDELPEQGYIDPYILGGAPSAQEMDQFFNISEMAEAIGVDPHAALMAGSFEPNMANAAGYMGIEGHYGMPNLASAYDGAGEDAGVDDDDDDDDDEVEDDGLASKVRRGFKRQRTAESLYRKIRRRQVTGRGVACWRDLPKYNRGQCPSDLNVRTRVDQLHHTVPSILDNLANAHMTRDWDHVLMLISGLTPMVATGEEHLQPVRVALVEQGGMAILDRLLFDAQALWEQAVRRQATQGHPFLWIQHHADPHSFSAVITSCLCIIRSMFFQVPGAVDPFADDDDLLDLLFGLLSNQEQFQFCNEVIEELLAIRSQQPRLYDISRVPVLPDYITNFTGRQLAHFCRVASFLTFGQDDKQSPKLIEQDRHGDQPMVRVLNRNHAILCRTPHFLERLVHILKTARTVVEEIQQLDRAGNVATVMSSLNLYPVWSEPPTIPEILPDYAPVTSRYRQPIFTALNFVELLVVMCSLFGSRRNIEVQRTLVDAGLIPALRYLLDQIDWSPESRNREHSGPGIHGPGCECSLEDTLKTQFLRLFHNVCEARCDLNKNLLLSTAEAQAIGLETPEADRYRRSPGPKGLITRLIETLMSEPADSNFRYWLLFPIESFLRLSLPQHQLFVAQQGFLQHVLSHILSEGFQTSGSYQMNFDLLGELLKFNRDTFVLFNSLLTEDEFQRLGGIIIDNLVDSNVFLRSLALSINKFRVDNRVLAGGAGRRLEQARCFPTLHWATRVLTARRRQELGHYDLGVCWAASFLANNHTRILHDLMGVVQVGELTQMNLCCLNTALVLLILVDAQDQLARTLQEIRELSDRGPEVLSNFAELLGFWEGDYVLRGSDAVKLEVGSDIHFHEWCSVVKKLLGPKDSPCSIHYKPLTTNANAVVAGVASDTGTATDVGSGVKGDGVARSDPVTT